MSILNKEGEKTKSIVSKAVLESKTRGKVALALHCSECDTMSEMLKVDALGLFSTRLARKVG